MPLAAIKLDSRVENKFGVFCSRAVFLPATDALSSGLNGLVGEPFFTVARVVAAALLELAQESGHAQRAKRASKRLVASRSQFSGVEHFSFHLLFSV